MGTKSNMKFSEKFGQKIRYRNFGKTSETGLSVSVCRRGGSTSFRCLAWSIFPSGSNLAGPVCCFFLLIRREGARTLARKFCSFFSLSACQFLELCRFSTAFLFSLSFLSFLMVCFLFSIDFLLFHWVFSVFFMFSLFLFIWFFYWCVFFMVFIVFSAVLQPFWLHFFRFFLCVVCIIFPLFLCTFFILINIIFIHVSHFKYVLIFKK